MCDELRRRRVLCALVGTTVVPLAGCSGDGSDGGDRAADDPVVGGTQSGSDDDSSAGENDDSGDDTSTDTDADGALDEWVVSADSADVVRSEDADGGLRIDGDLFVESDLDIEGRVDVDGEVVVSDGVDIDGPVLAGSALVAGSDVSVTGNLEPVSDLQSRLPPTPSPVGGRQTTPSTAFIQSPLSPAFDGRGALTIVNIQIIYHLLKPPHRAG